LLPTLFSKLETKTIYPLFNGYYDILQNAYLFKVYLAITAFVWALAVVFYFSRIPEISDDDMQYQQEITPGILRHDQKPIWRQYRLFLAVWGQFMYVGSEGRL
jgi:fucose permease